MSYDVTTMPSNIGGKMQSQLKPWDIYKVTFEGAEFEKVQSAKKPGTSYDVVSISFKNNDGYYVERLFSPEGDLNPDQRITIEHNGKNITLPSPNERAMALLAHICAAIAPENYSKFHKVHQTFKDMAISFIAQTSSHIGQETCIKLEGTTRDGRVFPCRPKIVSISANNVLYVSDNFVGDELAMSEYQLTKQAEYRAPAAFTPLTTAPFAPPEDDDDDPFEQINDDAITMI